MQTIYFLQHKMQSITIICPLYIRMAKHKKDGKKYWINLNNFNTRKGKGYNSIKARYMETIKDQFEWVKMWYIESIHIQMVYGNKRKVDRDNYTTACRKFLQDALVQYGSLPDDNDEYIGSYMDTPMQYIKDHYECIVHIKYTENAKNLLQ